MTEVDGASAPIVEDARTRARDTDVWRIATWLVPVAVQAVMAFGAGVM
ncbi:hypothetical protein JMUB5695_02910 [Mycobacterium heckeshornense]|uniref:Uncharacterized protein n=1 Tax=Mycobacterium heckeshornense TaxID=110505 RepID=A0A7R7YRW0_9MYCO|nr:hypothetical protein MHEC_30000 [Mycobacterium heckeshornense]BCQ09466.1 hypothetical protein JMUB5695_02910 [Mycobacterium heckeshornense]